MYTCKHSQDHSYPQHQTEVPYDASNKLYDLKREVTVICEFGYPLKGKSGSDHFGTVQKWISVDVTLDFECRKKIFFQASVANIYVFANILRIIVIRRNKRECHTMPLTDRNVAPFSTNL